MISNTEWYHNWWARPDVWHPVLLGLVQEKDPVRALELEAIHNIMRKAILGKRIRQYYGELGQTTLRDES